MDRQKLIEDTIMVDAINKDGKVFDKVSRISAQSKVNKLQIELDVNTDIYPMDQGSYYKLLLASSVNADGSDNFDIVRYENEGAQAGMETLFDQYDYVMNGKVFKYQLVDGEKKINIFISFGGLLMSITGDIKSLKALEIDSRVYLLMNKI